MKSKNETAARHAKGQDAVASEEVQAELRPGPSHAEIEQRAYEIHLERGGIHGQDLEDWLQAERELTASYPKD
jgi:hypothetical protein